MVEDQTVANGAGTGYPVSRSPHGTGAALTALFPVLSGYSLTELSQRLVPVLVSAVLLVFLFGS